MKLSNLNEWLSFAANFGVLVGIVFLAIEISQNTTAIRAEIYQTRSHEVANSQDFRAESEFYLPTLIKVMDDSRRIDASLLDDLTRIEKERLWSWTDATIRRVDNNMYQCEIGYHDENFCLTFRQAVRELFPQWEAVADSVGAQVNPAFTYLYEALD